MEPIILASGSLRRQEFFRLMGLPFNIMPSQVDESVTSSTEPGAVTEELAVRKVRHIVDLLQGRIPPWICGADTVVSVDGDIFGKPRDRADAERMLRRLQGRDHQVHTAVALFSGRDRSISVKTVQSRVIFNRMDGDEVDWYLNTGEWQGVAGAYKIQGLASCFIAGIEGSYTGIVGLPLREFYVMLREKGYPYGPALGDGGENP